jgi:hypothetical protein
MPLRPGSYFFEEVTADEKEECGFIAYENRFWRLCCWKNPLMSFTRIDVGPFFQIPVTWPDRRSTPGDIPNSAVVGAFIP